MNKYFIRFWAFSVVFVVAVVFVGVVVAVDLDFRFLAFVRSHRWPLIRYDFNLFSAIRVAVRSSSGRTDPTANELLHISPHSTHTHTDSTTAKCDRGETTSDTIAPERAQ